MYSGVTGEPMDGPSFIGCVFYQRLRHMVVLVGLFYQKKRVPHSDKIHARSLGPVNQMVHVESCKTVQDSTTDNPRKAVHGKGGCALEKWNVSLCLCTFCFFCGRGTAWDCLISHGASALMQERLLWWRECAHMQIPSLPQMRCISSLIVFPVWAMCIPRQQGMSPLFPGAGEEQYPRRCGGAIQLQVIAARDGCHGNRCAGDDGKCRSRMTKKSGNYSAAVRTERWGMPCVYSSCSRKRAVRTSSRHDTCIHGILMRLTPASRHSSFFSLSSNFRY